MKKLFLTIALCAFTSSLAFGQFLNPQAKVGSAFSVPSTGYLLKKEIRSTNVANPGVFPIGKGLSLYALIGSTNASESNVYFNVQFSVDNVSWFGDINQQASGGTKTFLVPIDAIGANAAHTNLLTEAQSIPWRWARVLSISNSCWEGGVLSNNVWITNFSFITH